MVTLSFGEDALHAHAGQILKAEPVSDSFGDQTVAVRLDPSLDAEMARLTADHVDEQGQLVVCGRVMSEPVLRSVIVRAEFVIAVPTAAEAKRLAKALTGGDCGLATAG